MSELEKNDCAIVFKEDGTIQTMMPKYPDDAEVPPHVFVCLGVMMLLHEDEDLHQRVQAKINKLLGEATDEHRKRLEEEP